ncbi:MAG: putative peptide zinc metalloprotease protein [Frankiaceae bacterium]|jgi:putative peptide zinc metalloprotease protein|nr:putative peptide zinc metalloprotease protein [Frankiaceae bacterium]
MTAVTGGPDGDTQVLRAAPGAARADVPVPAPGAEVLGPQLGSGYVDPPALVRRGDGQILQLTPIVHAILGAIDGNRTYDEIAAEVSRTVGRTLSADHVRALVEQRLRPAGLVLGADGSEPELRRASPLLALRPRFVVSSPALTRRITAPFAWLFHPAVVVPVTVAFAVVAFWVLFQKGLASAAYQAFRQPGLLLAVFLITVVSAGFHEFGHAAALRRGGGTPGAMGAGLYLIWPAFYTEVSDSYRLSRAARVRVDLGGLYFNAIVALAMFGAWEAVRWDGLLLVIAAQILQMIRQLPPLVRFDGYHLLADVTGVPDLFHRIGPTLRSFFPHRWRHPESRALRPWVRAVVALWVLLVVPLLLVSMVVTVIALPRIMATTASSVSLQAHRFGTLAGHGDIAGATVKALAILALLIPAGGVVFMLVRAGRGYGLRIWRRTSGRPLQRAVAVLVGVAMLGGLAYAWWPHGNYRPIQPWERGTITDALPAAMSSGLQPGRTASATTVWAGDGGALPTADHPVVAVVMTPKTGNGPTWVFPFNKPAPAGPGGNQAMAVVTRNGGVVYNVAFALVWVTSDVSLNRNEAYAFASCTGCRAVAIAFQVVLLVGDVHVVAPQNIAAAVGYHCVACVTQALATQLVVSVDSLSPQAKAALLALWAKISALSTQLGHLTFAQIQAELATFEREILAIVKPAALAPAATATPTAGASSSPAPSASESPSSVPTQSASPESSASASASASPSDSSSPSTSPSPSASQTP